MKVQIKENAITINEIKEALDAKFGDSYTIFYRNKKIISVAKSNLIGAMIMVTKNKIFVNGGFPKLLTHMIFTLLFIALGIIIPLILYFLFFHKKMKSMENEVALFIKEQYKDIIIN